MAAGTETSGGALPGGERKETIGTESIDKMQPWRDIVQPESFAQPEFFGEKPTSKAESTKKIRLLAELDSKSR